MSTQEFTGQTNECNYRKKNHSDSDIIIKQNTTNRKQLTKCKMCKKKVGLLGFPCKCSNTYDSDKIHVFCSTHRHPEEHNCPIDYKELGKKELGKKNPVVCGNKFNKVY